MSNSLDTPLDYLVNRRGNSGRGRGWGRGGARGRGTYRERAVVMTRGGPLRANVRPSPYKIAKSFSRARDMIWQHDLFNDSMVAAGLAGAEAGTKLYVSNLDFGVSNEDIKELFSEVGDLKRSAVHYDRNGRPSGSAEVVFVRRSDALAALKRYNNVQLDGKAMKIEIIGDKLGLPVSAHVNVVGRANGGGKRTVSMMPNRGGFQGGRGGFQAGRRGFQGGRGGFQTARGGFRGGRGGFRGRGGFQAGHGRGRGQGRGRTQPTNKSADDLDKELEKYHSEAMNTS